MWDGPTGALAPFWDAVHVIDPEAEDEALLSGAHRGHLTELFEAAGLRDVEEDSIAVDVVHPDLRGVVGAVHIRRGSGR